MKTKRILKLMIAAAIAAVLLLSFSACGDEKETTQSADLSDADIQVLMEQVAASEQEKQYTGLPDQVFATAEVFGVDRDDDKGTAYVRLSTAEYVTLKDRSYLMAGSEGEAIIKFKYSENGPKLSKVEWSADGSEHDPWMNEKFPEKYLEKAGRFEEYGKDGRSRLSERLDKEAEKAMSVPVEKELELTIDQDKGTYEIVKTKESGSPENDDYKFETETVEQGKLSEV